MAVAIVLLGVGLIVGARAGDDLRVTVKQGVLEGVEKVNRVNKEPFYAFLGIPYAAPPLGEKRFKDPEDPLPWEGVFNATEDGNACLAHDFLSNATFGNEDCLVLNVYTTKKPQDVKGSLRPVMVWIHNGSFMYGTGKFSAYGPDFLMRHDVVLVSLNYRLGVFGFLSVQDDLVPGNAGLKDQVKALQWVKENIEAFGGDPNCVTIFGQGAGGASVHYLMLSPSAKGLFHRAIAMSGVAISPWASITENKETAYNLGNLFDCNTTISDDSNAKLIDCLQNVEAQDLAAHQYDILSAKPEELLRKDINLPCVEPEGTKNAILTKPPVKLLESGNFSDVPFMLGTVLMETLPVEILFSEEHFKNWSKLLVPDKDRPDLLLPRNLDFGSFENTKIAGQKAKEFYFQNQEITPETVENYINMTSDSSYLFGVHEAALLHAKNGKSPVYFYRFTYQTEISGKYNKRGTSIGDDTELLLYKWGDTTEISPKELEILNKIQKLWVNFAEFGNPTPEKSSSEVIWEPFTPERESYLDIGKNLTAKTHLEKERMDFWTKLVSEANATIV